MAIALLLITCVRRKLVRNGLVICVASMLLPATSASIGVKSRALVSLTSVIDTDGSAPNRRSSVSAVVTPAKPPPRITIRVFTSRGGGGDSYSGPQQAKTRSLTPCEMRPRLAPYRSQPIKDGNSDRIPSIVQYGA